MKSNKRDLKLGDTREIKVVLKKSNRIANTADFNIQDPHERDKEGNMYEQRELAAKYEQANAKKFLNKIHQ